MELKERLIIIVRLAIILDMDGELLSIVQVGPPISSKIAIKVNEFKNQTNKYNNFNHILFNNATI